MLQQDLSKKQKVFIFKYKHNLPQYLQLNSVQ